MEGAALFATSYLAFLVFPRTRRHLHSSTSRIDRCSSLRHKKAPRRRLQEIIIGHLGAIMMRMAVATKGTGMDTFIGVRGIVHRPGMNSDTQTILA